MTEKLIFSVPRELDGQRIDRILPAKAGSFTRSACVKILEEGGVTVNSRTVGKSYKVKFGDEICLETPEPKALEAEAQDIPLDIRFEDGDLLVVNKPKGMVVHPAAGNLDGTLVNALLHYCGDSLSGINGVIRPGIVHRIDKDTSGLIIVAKNDASHRALACQIKEHSFKREYQAVVYGRLKNPLGSVDAPIGRHPVKRKQMAVTDKNSKNALTHYETVTEYKDFTHIKLRLETGRTHQIRVHMSYIGHPIAGDGVYGPSRVIKSLNGQCLHAGLIGFIHPRTGEYIEISSELPEYFEKFIHSLT